MMVISKVNIIGLIVMLMFRTVGIYNYAGDVELW